MELTIFAWIATVVYIIWSIRLGLRFVDGRWNVLEKPNAKTVKMIISILIGLTFGIILIILCVAKFMIYDLPKFLEMH